MKMHWPPERKDKNSFKYQFRIDRDLIMEVPLEDGKETIKEENDRTI